MNEAQGFDLASQEQKPQIEIPEEMFQAAHEYINTIPVVSSDFLKSELAARMIMRHSPGFTVDMGEDEMKREIAIMQASMNGEGVAEEIVRRLQESGVVEEKALEGAGFSVKHNHPDAIDARREAERSRSDRLMATKFGKLILKPVMTQTKQNVEYRKNQVVNAGRLTAVPVKRLNDRRKGSDS